MPVAVRMDGASSRLDRALQSYESTEWWYPIETDVGDDSRNWPSDVVQGLLQARMEWAQARDGRVHIVGRTYACVPFEGKRYCVLQVTFERVRQEIDRPAVVPPAGGIEAGGSEQVKAAAPARSFSPSLCG